MTDKMYCSSCGQKRKDNATFCTACGSTILGSSDNKGASYPSNLQSLRVLISGGVIVVGLLCFILVFQWINLRNSGELNVDSNSDFDHNEQQSSKCLVAYCSATGPALQVPGHGPRGRDLAPGVTETDTTVISSCPDRNSIHIEEGGQSYEGADVISADAGARYSLNGRTWEFNKHTGALVGFTSESVTPGGLFVRVDT